MPETMSLEREIIKSIGAELVLTPGSEGMKVLLQNLEHSTEPNAVILRQLRSGKSTNPLSDNR